MASILKGELYCRLMLWRIGAQHAKHDHAASGMEAVNRLKLQNAALRQLGATLASIAKGETAYRVQIWKDERRMTEIRGKDDVAHNAACQQLGRILTRMARGLAVECVMNWHQVPLPPNRKRSRRHAV